VKPDGDVRIVNLSSSAVNAAPSDGIRFENLNIGHAPWHPWVRYGQSKLANVLFTRELAVRYPQLISVAVHPGIIRTALWGQNLIAKTMFWLFSWLWPDARVGAYNTLWAATTKSVESGAFYYPVGRKHEGTKKSRDKMLAKALWEWSKDRVPVK
jgi:NAD(P)-dependent dehydrogenase (short-subunit alcohol dehydrogenase family)